MIRPAAANSTILARTTWRQGAVVCRALAFRKRRSPGVWYGQQYGGTATREAWVEGYLVPVDGRPAHAELEQVFVRQLRGAGIWGGNVVVSSELLTQVRTAVAHIRYWPASQGDQHAPVPLRLDGGRLADLDEAWVPVLTPDGPGVLVWSNSD